MLCEDRATRWVACVGLWLAGVLCPALAVAQDASAPPDLAANAAIQYWQAFGLMPPLDDDQKKIVENWQTAPLDEKAVKLIEASHPSLLYLRRGAKLPRCDWGLDYGDGISLLLPHLAKARDLAKLAALSARYKFERGDRKGAREDAHAMMVLGRHVGRDPIMICVLVRYLIEGLTVDLLAPRVPELKAPHAFVVSQYESLPPAPAVKDTILAEKKHFAEWIVHELRKVERAKPGSWRPLWQNLLGPEGPEPLKQIESFEEALKLLEEVAPVYDELAKVMALPRAEFVDRYPEFKRKTEAANALAALLIPNVDKLRGVEDSTHTRLALLMAAMAVADGGPGVLKDIRDPFGDGPFEYREVEGGFELKSKLIHDGQPVTLRAGRAKQE